MRSVAVGYEVKWPVSVSCGLAWYGWLLYAAAVLPAARLVRVYPFAACAEPATGPACLHAGC
jgi:hypothetical protein